MSFIPCENIPDKHAIITITLGELIDGGIFDWENDTTLKWNAYSDEQYKRLCEKFVARFYWREIGIIPVKKWRWEYVRLLNEIMPKYIILYKALDNGADVLAVSDQYGKRRNIYSDYPATMLSSNDNYASNGNDSQYEDITQGDFIAKAEEIKNRYNDIDIMILNECEQLFSYLLALNVNGF